jgi:hypothetical protein
MLILSRVCAEFRDSAGTVIYRVTPDTRLTFQEAPEAIREDPLFNLLVGEGALEAAVTPVRKMQLEADPMAETDAAGRKTADAPARKKAAAAEKKEG